MVGTHKTATYAAVALWQADTKVKYNANPKSGKSFDRYAKYEKARTIEESLSLGSLCKDLLFDYERGHLKILGPLRETPLNPFKLKPADLSKLRDADRLLIRLGCRHNPKAKKPRGYGTVMKGKNGREKVGFVKNITKMVGKQFPGYGYFPRTKQQEALESQAHKFYKNRPLREIPEIISSRKRKANSPDWSPGNSIATRNHMPLEDP